MRINAKVKWLTAMLALALVLVLLPLGETGADEPEIEANFGFIPNAEEASVSKVDLVNFEEVARYSTYEPRGEGYANDKYRVSRLAMDSGGNAWALNTMTGQNFGDYATAQGSVARINADEVESENPGITTSNSSSIVGEDVRVSYFDLGEPGDGPRTINILEKDGKVYLWIGFYLGKYFELFEYNAVAGTLVPVAGTKISVDSYTPYTAALDDNGIMWVVSRNASPFPSPVSPYPGVFRFDTNNLEAGIEQLQYGVSGQNNPYSIMIDNDGNVWVSDAGDWGTSKNRQFAVYESFTGNVSYVPVGFNVRPMRGFIQDGDGSIWATTIAGEVLKGTEDNGNWVFEIALGNLGELAGIGKDAQGYIWVVRYGNNSISRFNPADELPIVIDKTVGVGSGPYAYDNFIVKAPPVGCLEVTKIWTGEYDAADLPAYVEVKVYSDAEKTELVTTLTLEPEEWRDEVCGLAPGTYYVEEIAVEGFSTSYSPDDYIEVVADQTVTIEVTNEFEKEKCYGDETAWAYSEEYAKPNWNYVRGNNWGWTNGPLSVGTYEFPIYAGAGGNDIEKGTLVGTLYVVYDAGNVTVNYDLDEGYYLSETHLWVGNDVLPAVRRGYTNAPGQFPNNHYYGFEAGETMETEWVWTGSGFEGEIWVAAHAVVWMEVECEETEEY